jgi:carbon monoxide dehydrogenase subunit G
MNVEAAVTIDAPPDVVWTVVTDIEDSPNTVSGIEKVEILERGGDGLVGLKWKETRTIGGRKAVETMWVTEAEEGSYYVAEARSHGSIYRTRVGLSPAHGGTRLAMSFSATAVSFVARVFSAVLGPVMKGAIRKAFNRDLQDIKVAAESRGTG